MLKKNEARTLARAAWREFLQSRRRVEALGAVLADELRGRSGRVLIYLALPDEFDVLPWLAALPDPVQLFAPVTFADRLEFRRFRPETDRPVPGFHNVPGPAPEAEALEWPLSSGDVALIPCLGTNARGFRLGRGGGYYDRMRAQLEPARRLALLPQELSVMSFEEELHDLQLNDILTDGGIVRR